MYVQGVGMHGDTACAIGHFVKIQRHLFARKAGDNDAFGGGALLVDTEFIRKLIRAS